MSGTPDKLVLLGRIGGVHGIKGWLKVHSYTEPRENIVRFGEWTLRRGELTRSFEVEDGHRHGRTVLAKLGGIDDRDVAASWVGAQIAVKRSALPPCEPGEYYWTDLIGLDVETVDGQPLGRVERMLETGAHDVMVIAGERERLIPFAPGKTVRRVSLEEGRIVVDWDPAD